MKLDLSVSISDLIQIAIFLAILFQAWLAVKSLKADHERRKKQATFEFVNAVTDRYKNPINEFNNKYGVDRIIDISDYTEEDRFFVRSYLSEIERICAGINSGVFDYDILRKMMAGNLIKNHRRFGQYVENAQKKRRTFYSEFEAVVARLKADESQPEYDEANIRHS